MLVKFEFFGSELTLDVSEKEETCEAIEGWLRKTELSPEKKAQIKLVVYSELFKRNIDFNELLESALSFYAEIKIKQI